jgi:hypothetical protein
MSTKEVSHLIIFLLHIEEVIWPLEVELRRVKVRQALHLAFSTVISALKRENVLLDVTAARNDHIVGAESYLQPAVWLSSV